ncbi:ACP S-malonyltransferase [Massilia sp. W12]|uniref:ACP S-malonyltransferase n=1 Tax=Massilia sp. W12 TaxID=3126507 RepID=UPI0030D103A7
MKRIAILFSGQGSQYVGMGKRLYEKDEASRTLFDQVCALPGLDLRQLCFSGPADSLNQTENTQAALLLCSVLDYRHFQARTGLQPHLLAGHSLGELSALTAADAISLEDGLRLARARGLAMSRCAAAQKTGMQAVTKLALAKVEEVCAGVPGFGAEFVVANYNAPNQCVLSGAAPALERAAEALKKAGATIIPLKVSGAFHSPYMQGAAEEFARALEETEIRRPRIPVLANVDGQLHGDPQAIRQSLLKQLVSPVRWTDCMLYLRAEGIDCYLEAGPRAVLRKLAQANVPGAQAFALDDEEDQEGIEQAFAADLRAMHEKPSLIGKCMAVAVATRNNNWDDAAYQQGVVQPYQRLQALQEEIERNAREASPEELREALDLLGKIFATKGAPMEERAWRLNQILEVSACKAQFADYRFA